MVYGQQGDFVVEIDEVFDDVVIGIGVVIGLCVVLGWGDVCFVVQGVLVFVGG